MSRLTVPSQMFPAIGSQQRLSSSGATGRNKVILKPGRSLMDWVRLTKSGQNLGVDGRIIHVTPEELAKHNTQNDIWVSIRGKVYNVTPYIEFHPGGIDELMKAAGQDGTRLFDEIHKWVNVDSMLEKCLIGKLVSPRKAPTFKVPGPIKNEVIQPKPEKPARYDWLQCDSSVTIVLYTKRNTMRHEDIVIDRLDRSLSLALYTGSKVYAVNVQLESDVASRYLVRIGKGNNKVELILEKLTTGQRWKELGTPLEKNELVKNVHDLDAKFRRCTLISKTPVTHNTSLYCFGLPAGTRMCVPTGYHVHLKAMVQGMELARSYTPVLVSMREEASRTHSEGSQLYLMIKTYEGGTLTPTIDHLQTGDAVQISQYEGTFAEDCLLNYSTLLLLAAGTGLTPMVKLIHNALQVTNIREIKLIFFNKRKEDILWKDQLDELNENSRFAVQYVLSEPDENWTGMKGRITKQMLTSFIAPERETCAFVCGPTPFTELTQTFLKDLGIEYHAFIG